MDVDIDFVSEPTPPADAWAENDSTGHAPEGLDLEVLTRQFLERGGVIQQVAQGVSAPEITGPVAFNGGYLGRTEFGVKPELLEARAAHNRKMNEKVRQRTYGNDEKLVAQLGAMLDARPPRKEILAALRISDDLLQRLLRMYFLKDSRGDVYRKQTHEVRHSMDNPRDAALRETIEAHLSRGYTLAQTAKVTRLACSTIHRIVKKYKLEVKVRLRRAMPETAGQE